MIVFGVLAYGQIGYFWGRATRSLWRKYIAEYRAHDFHTRVPKNGEEASPELKQEFNQFLDTFGNEHPSALILKPWFFIPGRTKMALPENVEKLWVEGEEFPGLDSALRGLLWPWYLLTNLLLWLGAIAVGVITIPFVGPPALVKFLRERFKRTPKDKRSQIRAEPNAQEKSVELQRVRAEIHTLDDKREALTQQADNLEGQIQIESGPAHRAAVVPIASALNKK